MSNQIRERRSPGARRRGPVMACCVLLLATALSVPEMTAAQLTLSPTTSNAPTGKPITPPETPSPTPPLVTKSPTPSPVTADPTASPASADEIPSTAAPSPANVTDAPFSATYAPTSSPIEATPPTDAPIATPVTDAPTGAPVTGAPVTDSPTKAPVTSAPISASPTTRAPTTLEPSSAPTNSPTRKPTSNPTSDPTASPTQVPTTEPPSRSPTFKPSRSPVTVPTTPYPTESPTISPSSSPSKKPTPSPSKSPSQSPTVEPTSASPTKSPNKTPTTEEPTGSFTPEPTGNPTPSPSKSPFASSSPTESPMVEIESESPTYIPTGMPASSRPTTKLLGPFTTTNVKMTLTGVNAVEDDVKWSDTTAAFIEDWLNAGSGTLIQTAVYDATVKVKITSTLPGGGGGRRLGRNLQADSVEVTYTQTTSYRTRDFNVDVDRIVPAPFESPTSRDEYVGALKKLDGYEGLTQTSPVTISDDPDGVPPITDPGEPSADNGPNMAAIIGGACGGAAALVLLGGFIYTRRRNKGESSSAGEAASTKSQTVTSDPNLTSGASSVPTYGDQSVATVDYDYSKAYGGAGNYSLSDAGGTLGSRTRQTASDPTLLPGADNTIYSDDPTFDQAYEGAKEELLDIYAPPGKLGVVIDTPDDGAPVVHAVKDTSPIADKVQVGDKLVAVDDEDVRAMTAIKVSKLISRKSANASRKLTVIRYVNQ